MGRDASTVLSRGAEERFDTHLSPRLQGLHSTMACSSAALVAREPAKLTLNPELRDYVNDKLSGRVLDNDGAEVGPAGPVWDGKNKPHRGDRDWVTAWSPRQISKRLPVDFPDDLSMRISHEAIYQALYVPSRESSRDDSPGI